MDYLRKSGELLAIICLTAMTVSVAKADAALDAFNANHLDAARSLFLQQVTRAETRHTALHFLADIEFHAGNFDQAIAFANQAIASGPASADDYLVLGNAYGREAQATSMFTALRLAKHCLASYNAAYLLDPHNMDLLESLIEFHQQAPAIAGGSSKKLEQYLGELQALSPARAAVYRLDMLEHDKQPEAAMTLAQQLLADSRQQSLPIETRYTLALFFKKAKAWREAGELLEALLAIAPTTPITLDERLAVNHAMLQLAQVFLATHTQLDRGIQLVKQFQQTVHHSQDADYLWSYLTLARLYQTSGSTDQYREVVAQIKMLDYKKNESFAREFAKDFAM